MQAIDKIEKASKDGQIRQFTGNEYTSDIARGRLLADPRLVRGRAQLALDNKNVGYSQPEEGFMIFTDSMQIPVGAPHAFTAEKFMDFVYDPKIPAQLTAYINYVPPVKGVKEVLAEKRSGASPRTSWSSRTWRRLTTSRRSRRRTRRKSTPPSSAPSALRRDDRGGARVLTFFQRHRGLLPYLLLAPGLLWLVFFFAVPLYYMGRISLESGTIFTGYQFNWHFETYTDAISNYDEQFMRSFVYAGTATLIALVIGYPLAYAIAFRGGKWKTALLLLVILPFFVTYLIRTLSWETILDDNGAVVDMLKAVGLLGDDGRILATSGGGDRGHHLQLPAVHDPAAVREPRADRPARCSRPATTCTARAARSSRA